MHQCLSQLFGHRWCRVAGDFTGNDAQGNSMAHNSADLRDALRILYDKIRTEYTQTADYGKISQCKQKDEEDSQDFLDRMRRVFRANTQSIVYRRCGKIGHYARECRAILQNPGARDDNCWICNEPGHFARECNEKRVYNPNSTQN
ncbi:hypothetical protein ILYODFUR_038907 [Ilyodon furcidens]|uniref:CCHC-type domain-containing protein n=1 Tax=Ilyodon furcidens TaxID=33524 RepID=A0ABV0V1R5_9TELE